MVLPRCSSTDPRARARGSLSAGWMSLSRAHTLSLCRSVLSERSCIRALVCVAAAACCAGRWRMVWSLTVPGATRSMQATTQLGLARCWQNKRACRMAGGVTTTRDKAKAIRRTIWNIIRSKKQRESPRPCVGSSARLGVCGRTRAKNKYLRNSKSEARTIDRAQRVVFCDDCTATSASGHGGQRVS